MRGPYPKIEPYERGMLDVGDGNRVFWETWAIRMASPPSWSTVDPESGCST